MHETIIWVCMSVFSPWHQPSFPPLPLFGPLGLSQLALTHNPPLFRCPPWWWSLSRCLHFVYPLYIFKKSIAPYPAFAAKSVFQINNVFSLKGRTTVESSQRNQSNEKTWKRKKPKKKNKSQPVSNSRHCVLNDIRLHCFLCVLGSKTHSIFREFLIIILYSYLLYS